LEGFLPAETSGIPLAEFLRDLAIAWKNLAAYPAGHPARGESIARAHRRLAELVRIEAPLVLGVSRDGLILGQEKLDSAPAQRLAEALHRQRVAVLMFDEEVSAAELESFLRALTVDPRETEVEAIWDRLMDDGVRGIALEPVDYQAVVMTDEPLDPTHAGVAIWETITRELLAGRRLAPLAAERALGVPGSVAEVATWIENLLVEVDAAGTGGGLGGSGSAESEGPGQGPGEGPGATGAASRASLGGDGPGDGAGEEGLGGDGRRPGMGGGGVRAWDGGVGGGRPAPARIAGSRAAARGEVLDGLTRAVSTHLSRASGAARPSATREILDLIGRLPPGMRPVLLQASLRALATADDAEASLRELAARQSPANVLATLRHLAAERVQLSAGAIRLTQELMAERARESGESPLDPAVLAAMRGLFQEVDIDRLPQPAPATDDRRAAIELPQPRALLPEEAPELGARRDSLSDDALARQLTHTLLELVAGAVPERAPAEATLWRLEDLYRGFLLGGRIRQAIEIVEALGDLLRQARAAGGPDAELRRCFERLANREAVRALLSALPQLPEAAAAEARRLIAALGSVAIRHLVSVLSEESDRSSRHQLLDLLVALGPTVVPEATFLLADQRWFVVRNMILLLRTIGDQTSLPQVRRLADHPDLRVRLEAIKSLFAFDPKVPIDLLSKAINDRDPKLAESAISLVAAYNITQAVGPLVELLRRHDLLGLRRTVRLRAIRTLGRLGDPAALDGLEPFFRERLIQLRPREERRAAFAALGDFSEDVRRPWVERGLASRDREVRTICARLQTPGVRRDPEETHV